MGGRGRASPWGVSLARWSGAGTAPGSPPTRTRRNQVGEEGDREGEEGSGRGRGTSSPVAATARRDEGRQRSPPSRGRDLTAAPSLPLCSPRRRLAERRRVLGLRERERGRGARRGGGAERDPRAAAAGADRLHLGAGLPAGEDLPAPEVPGGLGAEEAGGCLAALRGAGGSRRKRIFPARQGQPGSAAFPARNRRSGLQLGLGWVVGSLGD